MVDVIVVGAGPAGSRAAEQLARLGLEVLVLEEHDAVGAPVHCTGIVGHDCMEQYELPRSLALTSLDGFRVVAPDLTTCVVPGSYRTYVLDRAALDRLLAQRAETAGARLLTQARVIHIEQTASDVRVFIRYEEAVQRFDCQLLVLACGAMSDLPARCGISAPAAWYRTVQGEWAVERVQGADVLLGSRYTRGSFGWAVELGLHHAKVGLLTPQAARVGYENLLDTTRTRSGLGSMRCKPRYRRMPLGVLEHTVVGRVVAVGDAAGQVKTTTGGGIYYAMMCADLLAKTVKASWKAGACEPHRLQEYDRAWKLRLEGDLAGGLLARRAFEGFTDDDLNRLVRLCQRDDIQGLIARHWHFDFHRNVMVALATAPILRRLAADVPRSAAWQRLLRLTGRISRTDLVTQFQPQL